MRPSALNAAMRAGLLLGLMLAVPSRAALPDAATQARLDAESWEALGRADLAQLALNKLLLTRPDDIDLLYEIGQLSLRLNQVDAAARTLKQMQRQMPQAMETAQLALAVRSASKDRLKLAGIRRLVEIGRHDDAVRQLRTLFPDGAPDGDLGISYYRILFERPADRQAARAGVAAIAARWPDQIRYRLALADLQTRDRETRATGLRQIEAIAARQHPPSTALLDLWRRSLLRGRADADSQRSAQRYRALAGDDPELRDWRRGRSPVQLAEGRRVPGRSRAEPPVPADLARALALREQARSAQRAGDVRLARAALESALRLAPDDPFLRLALTQQLRAAGDAAAADRLTDEALQRIRTEPPSVAAGNVPESKRRHAEALALAASAEDARRHGGAATALLEQAQALQPDDPWLRFRLARRYLAAGVPDEARMLMDEGLARAARRGVPDHEIRYASALLLESLDDTASARQLLAGIPDAERSAGMRALDQRLAMREVLDRIDRLIAAGDRAQAAQALAASEPLVHDDPDGQRSLATRWGRIDRPAEGIALLDRAGGTGPAPDVEARLLLAELLDAVAAKDAAADVRLAALLPSLLEDPALDAGQQRRGGSLEARRRLRDIERQYSRGDHDAAMVALDQAIARYPDQWALRDARAEHRLGERHYEAALLDLRAVASGSDEAWRAARARDRIADLDARSDGFVAIGPSLRDRPGPAGLSRFTNTEIPLELRWPLGVDRALFAHVDQVYASAGRLPADYERAALFGQVQAQGPAALARFPDGVAQSIDGVALAAGWQNGPWRADLGSTPIGFPVVDVVGGLRWSDQLGGFDVTADLARRPLTNSVLAYGGARDPATGATWGGARNQRLKLRIAQYGERLSFSSTLEAGVITGRQLPSNAQVQVSAGVDWKFVDAASQKLFIGLDGRYWHYDRYLGEYSYGHGGYYSPQLYTSLGLPLEWQGRIGRLSYRLRGALSLSYSEIDAAPFYPGQPALQAQALGSPLPAGYAAPVYGASSGSGFGKSLSGAIEYALTPRWSLGGSFDIDRAAFYAPNFFSLYLRRSFKPQSLIRSLPPRPPEPYSSY